MMKRTLVIVMLLLSVSWGSLFPSSCLGSDRKDKTEHISVTFEPTDQDILNPERGFYRGASLVPPRDQSGIREQGYTLVMSYVRLDPYRNSDMPAEFLRDLDEGFEQMRKAGLKVILRFAYNIERKGEDAPKKWVLRHLEQLRATFLKNMDVIAVLQAGFIGAWGEWHSSVHQLDTPEDRKEILMKALEVLPPKRMVQVRSPKYKEEIFGKKLDITHAFSGAEIARVGYHNDCFLSSPTDAGTYSRPLKTSMEDIAYLKSYVEQEGRFTCVGGETCRLGGNARVTGANALRELEAMHWSYLNAGFHRGALAKLESDGCMPEIRRRLGYRLVLQELTVPKAAFPGHELKLRAELVNEGFASPYNERPVFLVLVNRNRGYQHRLRVESADPRWWFPGKTIDLDLTVSLPANLPIGSYGLFLWLPDDAEHLRDMPEYAIRLANKDVWQPETGFNLLFENLRVTD